MGQAVVEVVAVVYSSKLVDTLVHNNLGKNLHMTEVFSSLQ